MIYGATVSEYTQISAAYATANDAVNIAEDAAEGNVFGTVIDLGQFAF